MKLNFTYITVIKYKAGPGFDDQLEHPPVQINSSSPWLLCQNDTPLVNGSALQNYVNNEALDIVFIL